MIESSRVREEYFVRRDRWNKEVIMTDVKFDSQSGVPVQGKEIYGALHADYIFYTMNVVESFQGALAAAWELTTKTHDMERALQILLNPTKYKGNIQGELKSQHIEEDTLCRLIAVPRPSGFDSSTAGKLRTLLQPTFERVETCARFSQEYWDAFRSVRNVYAHNFRFVFFDGVVPLGKPRLDSSIIAYVEAQENLVQNLVFIGAVQRIAMGELAFMLGSMERWVYQDMRLAGLNEGRLVLPNSVPYLSDAQKQEYRSVWEAQGYDFGDPKRAVRDVRSVVGQVELHERFIKVVDKWGHSLVTADQHGNLKKLDIDRLRAKRSELRDRRRPKP